jgi:NAD(P)-dependent dehydrogenase (short-subunit alcohol dehydrogenase family)
MVLRGKTLILTGASRGIGRALSLALAQRGVQLVLNARSAPQLEEVRLEIEQLGGLALAITGSAASDTIARSLVETAQSMGSFMGFIHNAGVLHGGPLVHELPEPHFDEVLDANLKAGFQLVRYAYPLLLRQGQGLAVFLGSGVAQHNIAGMGIYAVAKAAEEHLARQLALEAPEITCFTYRPGVVETDMQRQLRQAEGGGSAQLRPMFQGYRDQGRLLSPQQAAEGLLGILEDNPHRFHGQITHPGQPG